MTSAANDISNTTTPPVALPALKSVTTVSHRWVGYLAPVVDTVTTAVTNTQDMVEKRLGFCPAREALKATSKALDVLGHGLVDISKLLMKSKFAGGSGATDGSQQI